MAIELRDMFGIVASAAGKVAMYAVGEGSERYDAVIIEYVCVDGKFESEVVVVVEDD